MKFGRAKVKRIFPMTSHSQLAARTKNEVIASLRSRGARPGEIIEFGWIVLRVCGTASALDVETLDLQAMASFTTDLSRALQIHNQQMDLLRQVGAEPETCTQRHAGLVSQGYVPGQPGTFLTRLGPTRRSDSGWVIGSVAERMTKQSLKNSRFISLYEISLSDPRLLPFWLLPSYFTVVLHDDSHELIPPDTDIPFIDDFEPEKPWWKFW
jgi:hypothetical protein